MSPYLHPCFCQLFGWWFSFCESLCYNFFKGREVTLPCSYRGAFILTIILITPQVCSVGDQDIAGAFAACPSPGEGPQDSGDPEAGSRQPQCLQGRSLGQN